MPIYPDLNLVFIHVPKTAGGAIEELLEPHKARGQKTPWERILSKFPRQRDINTAYVPGHSTAQYHRTVMGPNLWDSYTSFSVVRNPYDKAISGYEYERQTATHHRHEKTKKLSFEEYVTERVRNQTRYLCDASGALIVDRIIAFENLHAELDAFFEEAGITERLPRAGTRNSSKKNAREQYLTENAVQIINRKCAHDFEVLDYEMIG